jgi:hypothetical protein
MRQNARLSHGTRPLRVGALDRDTPDRQLVEITVVHGQHLPGVPAFDELLPALRPP